MKKLIFALVAVLIAVLTLSAAFASNGTDDEGSTVLDIEDIEVWINDRKVKNDVVVLKAFDRGEELEVEVEFTSKQDAEEVQIVAFITGYHRSHRFREKVFDFTPTFDVEADVSYKEDLLLVLPDDFDLDTGDELKLRIEISDKFSKSFVQEYNLKVEALRNNVVIQDILLDPSSRVEAGRGLFAAVRVKNWGEDEEDDVKITVSIPALDLKATEYMDELEVDDAETSEDMFLRVPVCADAGDYVVKATVEYADGDETVTKETIIEILENPECELAKPSTDEKTVVTVPGKQDVIKGTSGTVYPVILENRGVTDKSYELKASGLDTWATHRFDPGAFILVKAGQTETAYLYVTPNEEASAGEKVFMVSVETDGDKKQIALTANVIAGEEESPLAELGDFRQVLLIGVIVLIVLLIILGFIIGFNKLKGADEDEEVSGQTYY